MGRTNELPTPTFSDHVPAYAYHMQDYYDYYLVSNAFER
jgi:hypothetical protein